MVDQAQTLRFAVDIARGMAFLHAMEPLIPRYYLNSKNILVSTQIIPLISLLSVVCCGFESQSWHLCHPVTTSTAITS